MDSVTRRGFVASVVAGSAAAAVGFPVEAADVWTPPENPVSHEILDEARRDAAAGRYAVALAKHVWYHHHALEYQRGQYGVRLSFALSDWRRLAEHYPPALEKLKSIRDEAGKNVVTETGKKAHEFFHDFVAINRQLKEPERVRQLFFQLHKTDPEKAKDVYSLAERVLIRAKEYELCGQYIDPETQVWLILQGYRAQRKFESKFDKQYKQIVERKMTNDSATLVALLAINGRQEEADKAAEELKQVWDEKRFHEAIDKALTGNVPDPWP